MVKWVGGSNIGVKGRGGMIFFGKKWKKNKCLGTQKSTQISCKGMYKGEMSWTSKNKEGKVTVWECKRKRKKPESLWEEEEEEEEAEQVV